MISIVIPTYLQPLHGGNMLIVLLNSIRHQEVSCPYEIIVSDNDDTDAIKKICDRFDMLPIKYYHNPIKGASENFNNGFDLAKYDWIKPMCMDDAFVRRDSINKFMPGGCDWLISNSVHINEQGDVYGRRYTKYNHRQLQTNITGMPSVMAFRKCDIRFHTGLKTICDMFFYYQLYEKYGAPAVINEFTVACRFWRGSLSQNQPSNKANELLFLREKQMIKC